MSRSGYTDDCEYFAMWRGQVASAIRGKRGQQFLRELADGMDAMPVKELIANDLVVDGQFCAMGVVGAKRGVDMEDIDADEPDKVARAFNIAPQMAQEIAYINDECGGNYKTDENGRWRYAPDTPAERWNRVRKWVAEKIKESAARNGDVQR